MMIRRDWPNCCYDRITEMASGLGRQNRKPWPSFPGRPSGPTSRLAPPGLRGILSGCRAQPVSLAFARAARGLGFHPGRAAMASGAGERIFQPQSTTYHMVAKGDGGTADASVRVTVNPAPPIVVAPSALSLEKEFKANVQDIFFDYDKYDLRGDAKAPLTQNAKYLLNHPNENILIGGYCDERGSNEYNLALGQRRADSAKKALVEDGVSATRIRVISYGKEKPFCTQSTEACWQENRRDGFSLDQK